MRRFHFLRQILANRFSAVRPRGSGDPALCRKHWSPASAGVSGRAHTATRLKSARNIAAAIAVLLLLGAPRAHAQDWKARWDATVAAAEKEGALDVSGPSGKLWQDALMTFQAAYPKIK